MRTKMSFIFQAFCIFLASCCILYIVLGESFLLTRILSLICANPLPPPELLQPVHSKSSGIITCFHERSITSQTCGSNPTSLLYFYGNHRTVFDIIFPKFKRGKKLCISFCLFDLQFISLHPICSLDGTQL